MLDFEDGASAHEKSFITSGLIGDSKKAGAPFSTVSRHTLVHTTELVLPKEVHDAVWPSIREKLEQPRYLRVIMPLIALLEGDFFNDFVKTGSVVMLSEGRPGVDDVFSLEKGILALQMGKEKYERTGLSGKPIRSGGRKHAKERFEIEIDLRQPSMLHGKKGFERIIWACRNVLNASLTWLVVCDAVSQGSLHKIALALQKYQPTLLECAFEQFLHPTVNLPQFSMDELGPQSSSVQMEEYCNDISEWLALVSLRSPRISADDVIDPYLCRYTVPQSELLPPEPKDIVSLRWHGAMNTHWINQLLTSYFLESQSHFDGRSTWSALSASSFRKLAVESKDGYTILCLKEKAQPTSHFVAWEFVGASIST